MAEKITSRSDNFSKWYQDVVIQARLADYSPVKGCMVIRPNGYSIWEKIQKELDQRIKKRGVKNAYFPLFIPERFLKKEAQHIEGFAPQCAVVTHAGAKDLEEKLVVRPTSETIINSMFSKWIQSYRDLPMKLNQWANVVRWEMRTRLFLRTTEFLWQEGHTCHATALEAKLEAKEMLRVYAQFAEQILAIPVICGQKSESEKFAGADKTYCIEAMMQDKKALQAGTSHYLGTHFSNAFNTVFLDQDGKQKLVYQTSWGVTTRLIGAMVMTHSDDKGLVLPPRVASTHVVIVPIIAKETVPSEIYEHAESLAAQIRLSAVGSFLPYEVVVEVDRDETKQLGWKFHEYELVGIPIRIDFGQRDIVKDQVIFTRRDNGLKRIVSTFSVGAEVVSSLEAMQKEMFIKATQFRDQWIFNVSYFEEFKKRLEEFGGFIVGAWCQSSLCEEQMKEETKATIRCLPFDDHEQVVKEYAHCVICGEPRECVRALFGKNY